MTIDRSGQWWVGDAPADLDEYVRAFSAESYPVRQIAYAACAACGANQFTLACDSDEGCTVRTCVSCGQSKAMLDSEEYLDEADLEDIECPCGGNTFNTAVGFALYDDGDDVRWVYLVSRCTEDGVLGCFANWKIGYGPSEHLLLEV